MAGRRIIPDNPELDDAIESRVNFYVAGLFVGAMLFLIAVKKGLGPRVAV